MDQFKRVKRFLEYVKQEDIIIKKHFYDSTLERPIHEKLVRENVKKTERLLKIEKQSAKRAKEEKYKIWIKLSRRYALVLVIVIFEMKLFVITGWNTKWQR